jgi:hypothetical protein
LEGVAKPEDIPRVPWHFTLLLVALGIYLTWRLWQLGVWVAHKL